jgi:hypothetical protein
MAEMGGSDVVLVSVRIRARSRPGWQRDAEGRLVLGVAAPPVEGAANDEAIRSLAKALGVPPTSVSLHRGARSHEKVFAVSGVAAAEATARLERLA